MSTCWTRSRDPAAAAGAPGLFHDERDVNRLVVEEQAVCLLAVIAEALHRDPTAG